MLALRAEMDMIVIGAETLRRDNPSLATRGDVHFETRNAADRAPHPVKVVVTRSGDIPTNRAFFETGTAEKIIQRLRKDLESGAWDRKYGHYRKQKFLNCALRLIISTS